MKKKISKKNKNIKQISAEEFDRKFDNGEDMTPYMDLKSARWTPGILQRINIDIPKNIIIKIDHEADRVGITRTSLIKIWLAERVDRLAG